MATTELDAAMRASLTKIATQDALAAEGLSYLARKFDGSDNGAVLAKMAAEQEQHVAYLSQVLDTTITPNAARVKAFKTECDLMGFTFSLRRLHKAKMQSRRALESLATADDHAKALAREAAEHEEALVDMLDEDRLHYVGAMVLGLNDALVELTGAIAGVTFSLCNTKIVALTGIVTGISATLSMAASNYLAVQADGTNDAAKSSLYTGGAYLAAVVLLVLPYLLLPSNMYAAAFWIMLAEVVIILAGFNYYLSVATKVSFWKRFATMAAVSLSVALIAFLIGLAAKDLLGITVA
jgi:VIT1/CCC1 family predicted Fe2+/Mn2+ transporter